MSAPDASGVVSRPLISIILPTYNRSGTLREAIASVRKQTYERWELIVIDDGSTDDTGTLLAGLDEQRLRVIRVDHTGNPARVRNAGLAVARGTHVAFLDDDDLWRSDKLDKQMTGLEQSGCRWSYSAFERIDEQGRGIHASDIVVWRPRGGWILEELLRIEAIIALPTVIVERTLLAEAGGFDEAFAYCQDYELWFRLASRAATHVETAKLGIVRVHPRSHQADRASVHAAWVRVYAKTANTLTDPRLAAFCRQRSSYHAVVSARFAASRGDKAEGLELLMGSGRGAVASLKWWSTLARVLLPSAWRERFGPFLAAHVLDVAD